ncbi:serine, glycine, tyrosine and glutamine-rich protein-like [Oppia nitens]|uniref:serine, glycine, tyrosine and glutamine-rich protein-like n=1 Tax=Oppia nitens TaxID=1686743 RepID=UPI0023DB8276|nr:serine, glycine, tyrosine and glutamine-rich protein-like [Oppia nitens]
MVLPHKKPDACKHFYCNLNKCLNKNGYQLGYCDHYLNDMIDCCRAWKLDAFSCEGFMWMFEEKFKDSDDKDKKDGGSGGGGDGQGGSSGGGDGQGGSSGGGGGGGQGGSSGGGGGGSGSKDIPDYNKDHTIKLDSCIVM